VARSELSPAAQRVLLVEFDSWLGLGLATEVPRDDVQAVDPRIDALVAERWQARKARDFARADAIRDALAAEGVEIQDGADGSKWRRVR
jgi:cysteinyl-tRNA synthetase